MTGSRRYFYDSLCSIWCGCVFEIVLLDALIVSDCGFPVRVWAAGPLQSGAFSLQAKEAESLARLRGRGRAGVLLRPTRHRRCSKQHQMSVLVQSFHDDRL